MEQNKPSSKERKLEEQKQAYLKAKAERDRKLATDPEYRMRWEKTKEHFSKIALLNDSFEE